MSFESTGPDPILVSFVLFIVVMLVVGVWGARWHHKRGRALLQKWADENGYELVHHKLRNFRIGPFFWTTSRGQTVYFVTVRDQAGTLRKGWVRCGSWVAGLLSNQTEVRWEDPGPSP